MTTDSEIGVPVPRFRGDRFRGGDKSTGGCYCTTTVVPQLTRL
jgi:hypothetical protein